VVEGVERAGKTTLVEGLAVVFRARGCTVVCTHEPDTLLAKNIHRQLKSVQGAQLTLEQQLDLVHFGRLDHAQRKIAPALGSGAVVICEGYTLSSWVDQVAVQPDLEERFFAMQAELKELMGGRAPEYLLLDLPGPEAYARPRRSEESDQFNAADPQKLERRRIAYRAGIARIRSLYHILDAMLPEEELLLEALRALRAM
jgi:dTMP kinase